MDKSKEIKIPIRVRIISEIKLLLKKTYPKEISVEKLIAAYMEKEGTPRRLIIECMDSVAGSNYAKYTLNKFNKKESIRKK